MLSTSI